MTEKYQQYRESIKELQKDSPYEAIKDEMATKSEWMMELDNRPAVKHVWVDRGVVMSCENAGHPNHRSFKRMR